MITLYELAGKNDLRFSPPCWNVKLCLLYKNIDFETVLPSPAMGAFNFNAGLAGLLGSISMDFLGQISLNMGPGGSVAKIISSSTSS